MDLFCKVASLTKALRLRSSVKWTAKCPYGDMSLKQIGLALAIDTSST
jgi:hypothetical protein